VILDHREPGGEPIAFMYEGRVYQITAILGVLKAGKVYGPLDTRYPKERTTFFRKDSTE